MLGKMIATKVLPQGVIDLHFWQSWAEEIYRLESFDAYGEGAKSKRIIDGTFDPPNDSNHVSITLQR